MHAESPCKGLSSIEIDLQLGVIVKLLLKARTAQSQVLNSNQSIVVQKLSKKDSRREVLWC